MDAADMELFERSFCNGDRFFSVFASDDEFGDHRIVVGRNAIAGIAGAVDADMRSAGRDIIFQMPGRGRKIFGRVFGIDPELDDVPF